MTPLEHVEAATLNLDHIQAHWWRAEHNLVQLQSGYPSGHQGTARLDTGKDPAPDPCRADLRQADRLIDAILELAGGFFALGSRRPQDRQVAIHLANSHVRLLHGDLGGNGAALSADGATDCKAIHQATIELARITDRWSFNPTAICDPHKRPGCPPCNGVGVTIGVGVVDTGDWCSNHQRFDIMEPAGPEGLCDFCSSFVRGSGQRPDERIIRKRHLRERITPRDLKAGA